MDHDALAWRRLVFGNGGASRRDDATRFVTADDRAHGVTAGAVGRQVAAAHAGSLDLDDYLSRPRRGVRELAQLKLAFAEKYDASQSASS
jgi:hypothetical protein